MRLDISFLLPKSNKHLLWRRNFSSAELRTEKKHTRIVRLGRDLLGKELVEGVVHAGAGHDQGGVDVHRVGALLNAHTAHLQENFLPPIPSVTGSIFGSTQVNFFIHLLNKFEKYVNCF